MGTALIPYSTEAQARAFIKKLRKPWYAELDFSLQGDYEQFISDDDFSTALYEDACKFYFKNQRQPYEPFDIRPTLIERMTYRMIDEELHYLLTGTFLTSTTLPIINSIRNALSLKKISKITKKRAAEYRQRLAIENLPSWCYDLDSVMELAPYNSATKTELERLKHDNKKRLRDDNIRHKKLFKSPSKLEAILFKAKQV